jgi:hypothetical protein
MKRAILAAVLLAVGCAEAPDPPPTVEPDDIVKDREAFIPLGKGGPLKGKEVALLVHVSEAYMRFAHHFGPPDWMELSLNNARYYPIYVSSPYNVANRTAAKRWGITVPYSLVEVEVNYHGGLPFATKMRRLDGTREYPLDVTKTVEMLRKRYAADCKAITNSVETAMAAEGKRVLATDPVSEAQFRQWRDAVLDAEGGEVLGRHKTTGPRQTEQLEYMTWLVDRNVLRVAYRTRISDGSYTEIDRVRYWTRGGRSRSTIKAGVTFGVEHGYAYEVDRDGKLLRRMELKPEAFSEWLPLPTPRPRKD